jgi:hypothetical protein
LATVRKEFGHWVKEGQRMQRAMENIWAERRGRKLTKAQTESMQKLKAAHLQSQENQNKSRDNVAQVVKEVLKVDKPADIKVSEIDTSNVNWTSGGTLKNIKSGLEFLQGIVAADPTNVPLRPVRIFGELGETRAFHTGTEIGLAEVDGVSSTGTVIHEYGHHLEEWMPGCAPACREFLKYRQGSEKPFKFVDKFPKSGYDDDEEGFTDEFDKAFPYTSYYVGKIYDSGHTEILSMGIQKLYEDPVEFADKDPEYCSFILGILDGSMRGRTQP